MDYTEDLLYYARDPRFQGKLENPDAGAHRENPSCGDALTCTIRISERAGDSLPAGRQGPVAPSGVDRGPTGEPSWKEGERPSGQIAKIRFEGTGCVICLASATVLAEKAEGASIQDVLAFDKANMVEWLTCDVGPMRTNCMMLALLTLRDALCNQSSK